MVKKSKNLKKSQKITFFLNNFFFEKKYKLPEKKNAIPLVLPIEEISLRPELSSPPRFRIQGPPLSVTHERTDEGCKSMCLILDICLTTHIFDTSCLLSFSGKCVVSNKLRQ